jgi:hypothetical protein
MTNQLLIHAKELQWRLQKQKSLQGIPIQQKEEPKKNTRGTISHHYLIIGPTTKPKITAFEHIINNAVHFTREILEEVQQVLEATAHTTSNQIAKIVADETRKTSTKIAKAIEETEELRREEHQRYQEKLHKDRIKNKLLTTILVAPQLIPNKIHDPQHFEPPKYYNTKKTPTDLIFTTEGIESPKAEPTAIWTSRQSMRKMLTAPIKTTLYTTWPNFIYHKNKYYLFVTQERKTLPNGTFRIHLQDLHHIQSP